MGKTLVLFTDKDAYYFSRIQNPDIDIDQIFDKEVFNKNPLLKLLRKIKSPLAHLFYRKWYANLKRYERVIVLDATFQFDETVLHNIRKKNPDILAFLYSWNIVRDQELIKKEKVSAEREGFKFYSYDHGECEKYGLNYNTIMYDINLKMPNVPSTNDAFFLGYLKDRKAAMLSLYSDFIEAGYHPRFVIVGKAEKDNNLPFEFSEKYINYFDYLSMMNESRAILDIAQKGQDGLSMRVMEALFLDKKIITTNQAIMDAPFYNEKNILVIELGKTNMKDLQAFFAEPMVPYPTEAKEYYSFEKWVERFQ